MLSGGGSFETFEAEYATAHAAGCSGFMVGRALWGEAVQAPAEQRSAIIADLVRPRFQRLLAINAVDGG
jgi:tagatose-1,6-bisphosphate aldolase